MRVAAPPLMAIFRTRVQGDILQAQQRLGHRDASTTLRIYSHALPLTDSDAAARLDELYR